MPVRHHWIVQCDTCYTAHSIYRPETTADMIDHHRESGWDVQAYGDLDHPRLSCPYCVSQRVGLSDRE